MRALLQPLRVRLAIAGFAAIYTPVLVLLTTIFVTSQIDETVGVDQRSVVEASDSPAWGAILITAALLAPVAMLLAWWWAGRAVRPVEQALEIQEQLIEEASHELRTPLSVLATNADVLLSHPEPTVEIYRSGLERSRHAVDRMTEMIDSMLVDARGRARTIDRRPTELVRLATSVVEVLGPVAATAGVTLEGPDRRTSVLAPVHGPSVERALSNLVTNAIEHSSPGALVRVAVAVLGSSAELSVTDQGPGIGRDDQANVFDRYWRRSEPDGDRTAGDEPHGDRSAGDQPAGDQTTAPGNDRSGVAGVEGGRAGVGLGLAIVRQVAVAHGGEATVTSPVAGDRGTRFAFTVVAAG